MAANLRDLNPIFAGRFSAAVAAAEQATGEKASFLSGRRTAAQGVDIWNRATGGGRHAPSFPAARPGRSLHEQGMATDMVPGKVRNWIVAHAREYGLAPASAKRGFGWDPNHIQLDRGVLKTPYDSTPNAFAAGAARGLTPAQQAAANLASGRIPGGPPTLRRGATDAETGGAVTRLQRQLADADINPGPVDGKYGRQTAAAVRQAEKQYGLTPDRGVAGPQVQSALAGIGRTQDITSAARMSPAGGTISPAVSPTDIGFGRTQMPWDTSPAPGGVPSPAVRGDMTPRPIDPSLLSPGLLSGQVPHFSGGAPPSSGPGGAAFTKTATVPPDPSAAPLAPPPSQVVMTPHSLNSGVARGAPVPAPPVAPGGPPVFDARRQQETSAFDARRQQETQDFNARRPAADPYAAGRAYIAAHSPPRFFAGPGAGKLSPPGDVVPGGPPVASAAGPPGWDAINSDPVAAGRVGLNDLRSTIGGMQRLAEMGVAPTPQSGPQASNAAWPMVSTDPSRQAAMEALRAQPAPLSESDLAARNYGYAPGAARESDMRFLAAMGNVGHFTPAFYQGRQSQNVEDRRGVPYQPTSDSGRGFGGLPVASAAGLPSGEVPLFHGQPVLGGPTEGLNTGPIGGVGSSGGLPGGADRFAADFSSPVSGVTFMNGAPQGMPGVWAAGDPNGPGVVPAGDPPPGSPDLMAGYDPQTGRFTDPADTGGLSQPARVASRGAIGPVPYVKPQSVAQRAGGVALGVGANALLGPMGGILARALYNSATRGSFDKTSQYTGGPVTPYNRAAPNPYGGYTTGSSYSASPFTPSGAGWNAPSFNPVSGGALYAYNPQTHTYVDSQGRTHSYEPG